MRGDDAHVHPRLGRVAQGRIDAVTDDQIGRHGVHIALGLVDKVEVDRLPHRLLVQRVIRVGLDIVPRSLRGLRRQLVRPEAAVVLLHVPGVLPHGQEHDGHAPHRLPLEENGRVFPVAIPQLLVDILVGQVDAAGKGGVAVDDTELPVVPVVHADGNHRLEAVEAAAGDAGFRLKFSGVVHRQGVQGAHIVVDHPHIHPGGMLLLQNLHHRIPEYAGANNEVFQEDILFRLPQLLQHGGKHIIPQGKIVGIGVGIDRAAGVVLQVAGLVHRVGPKGPQLLRLVVPLQLLQHGAVHTLHLPALAGGELVAAAEQIHQPSKGREQQNGDDPGNFIPRVGLAADDNQHRQNGEHHTPPVHINEVAGKPEHIEQQHRSLEEDQQGHDHRPLKEQGGQFFNIHLIGSPQRTTTFSAPSSSFSSWISAGWTRQTVPSRFPVSSHLTTICSVPGNMVSTSLILSQRGSSRLGMRI